jgi:hypothetical protein
VTNTDTFQGSQPTLNIILAGLSGERRRLTREFAQQSRFLAGLMGMSPDELASSSGQEVSFLETVEAYSQCKLDVMEKILGGVQRMIEAISPYEYDRYFFGESDR